jgi:hypothetical protein
VITVIHVEMVEANRERLWRYEKRTTIPLVGLAGPPPAGTVEQRVELDVTVTASTLPASAQAFRIHYRDSSGDQRSTVSNVSLRMCGGEVSDNCVPS